jgi:hypothetical protein
MFGHNYIQTNTNNVNKTEQKLFYPLAPIVLVSTKCNDPWVLEFVVSNITGNNQWGNCISLDFYFCVSGLCYQQKLEPHKTRTKKDEQNIVFMRNGHHIIISHFLGIALLCYRSKV